VCRHGHTRIRNRIRKLTVDSRIGWYISVLICLIRCWQNSSLHILTAKQPADLEQRAEGWVCVPSTCSRQPSLLSLGQNVHHRLKFSLHLPRLLDIMHIDSFIVNVLAMWFIIVAGSSNLNYQTTYEEKWSGEIMKWVDGETTSIDPIKAAGSMYRPPFSLHTGKRDS
jgi:hypothetical protein